MFQFMQGDSLKSGDHGRAGARARPVSARSDLVRPDQRRGRGSATNTSGRYERFTLESLDDGWGSLDELPGLKTQVSIETPRTIITRNNTPDISFDRSINP